MPDENLTEYERQRLAHVQRNREYMARLGVNALADDIRNKMSSRKISTTSRKRVKREEPSEPTRRSSRVVGVKAEYDGSTIDALLDEDEENENGRARKRASVDAELDDDELAKDVVATSREWLAEAREKLLATRADVANSFVEKSAKDEAWRRDAVARWGDSVPSARSVSDWKACSVPV